MALRSLGKAVMVCLTVSVRKNVSDNILRRAIALKYNTKNLITENPNLW